MDLQHVGCEDVNEHPELAQEGVQCQNVVVTVMSFKVEKLYRIS
jgi:hypothetical protein